MPKKNVQKRHWMITLFPTIDEYCQEENILELIEQIMFHEIPNISYSIFQLEEAGSTGKLHLQLYVEFSTSYRFTKVKKLFDWVGFSKPHCEPRKHSREACKNYCSKSESRLEGTKFIEIGEWKGSGKSSQTGLQTCAELITLGYDEIWIAFNRPELFLRYGNRIKDLIQHRKLYEIREQKRKRFLSEAEKYQEEE